MGKLVKCPPQWASAIKPIQSVADIADATAIVMSYVRHQEDVKGVVGELNELDEMINAAEYASEARATYAALEASIYVEIVKKGWAESLGKTTHKCKAAVWLSEQSDDKYDDVMRLIIEHGFTLVTVWKKYLEEEDKQQAVYDSITLKHELLDEFARSGRVDMGVLGSSSYDEEKPDWENELDSAVADSTRIALRKCGAIGIGDGIYSDPDRHPGDLAKGIKVRKGNLARCICKLFLYCGKSPKEHPFRTELVDAVRMSELPIEITVRWDGTDDNQELDAKSIASWTYEIYNDIKNLNAMYKRTGLKVSASAADAISNAVRELVEA